MVKPSRRSEMAKQAVMQKEMSIRLACIAFTISETCYRYQPKLSDENAEIADWLVRLTHNQRNWGFGLCFLYLRNVKCFGWNHKRVYRIYRELELNLRIKPKKRLVREKPESLKQPESINQSWSMDFMHTISSRMAEVFGHSMLLTISTERGCVLRLIFLYPLNA